MIGDARVAIEIKSVEEVLPRHLKGLKTFASDYPESKLLIVSLDPINRKMGDVECIYIIDFWREKPCAVVWNTPRLQSDAQKTVLVFLPSDISLSQIGR